MSSSVPYRGRIQPAGVPAHTPEQHMDARSDSSVTREVILRPSSCVERFRMRRSNATRERSGDVKMKFGCGQLASRGPPSRRSSTEAW
jgi:hypothetical protein